MSGRKLLGRLPDRPAKLVLVSGEYPELAENLRLLGIEAVTTLADNRLPGPVQWHPDMQVCFIGGSAIALKNSSLHNSLAKHNIFASSTERFPKNTYPDDVLCNVLAWDRFVLGNRKTADKAVMEAAAELCASWIDVNQGYSACATALADKHSAITADEGIAGKLEQRGIEVLKICSEGIRLPGYSYGFIGGCCGKLAPDLMAFAGSLYKHPDGRRIKRFLNDHGIKAVELLEGELLDVGGIITLL